MPEPLLEQLRSLSQQVLVLLTRAIEQPPAEPSQSIAAQLSEWRDIAGQWRTDESFDEEVDRLRQARTPSSVVTAQ